MIAPLETFVNASVAARYGNRIWAHSPRPRGRCGQESMDMADVHAKGRRAEAAYETGTASRSVDGAFICDCPGQPGQVTTLARLPLQVILVTVDIVKVDPQGNRI